RMMASYAADKLHQTCYGNDVDAEASTSYPANMTFLTLLFVQSRCRGLGIHKLGGIYCAARRWRKKCSRYGAGTAEIFRCYRAGDSFVGFFC
ncbi:MAG: hypothetical protein V8R55_12180, partial [Dysosmobacter sp.]